jgi:hypothetical protein
MTPQVKARELINRFDCLDTNNNILDYFHNSKECALIAVNEILNEFPQGYNGNFEEKQYWKQVKEEIEKL